MPSLLFKTLRSGKVRNDSKRKGRDVLFQEEMLFESSLKVWYRNYKKIPMLNSAEHKILNSHKYKNIKTDGWMTCDFTSFSTVFQLYQDDGRLIMIGCVQWRSVYGREDFAASGDRTRSARSEGQRLTY